MNQRDQQLTEDVMRRVHFIHTARYLLTPGMIKSLVFVASCISMLSLVSIVQVIENMSRLPNVLAYFPYIFGAFLKTDFIVEFAAILGPIVGLWLVHDIIRGWSIGKNLQRNFARS